MLKNPPTVQEPRVWSPGQEDALEKGTATHSSILASRISWTEEPGGLQSIGSQRSGHDWVTNTHTYKITGNWDAGLFPSFNIKESMSMLNMPSKLSVQFSSVAQSCPILCDPMNRSTPGLPVHHQLPEFTQTHVHWVSDAIQPSHPLSSPSPPALNLSQHQGLFKWVTLVN